MFSIDQFEVLSKTEAPVLVMQGGMDESASPEKTTAMIDALNQAGKRNIDFKLYPDYNHSLNLSIHDDSADLVIEDMRRWLNETLR